MWVKSLSIGKSRDMEDDIAKLISQFSHSQMRQYCQELSERYRQRVTPFLEKREHRFAYLITRFPATFAAIKRVLQEISSFPIKTMLDLGAGPGTGFLAAQDAFSSIEKATLVETDPIFIEIGKQLIKQDVTWLKQDLKNNTDFEAHDLVLLSYSIGEIPERFWESILQAAWKSTTQFLVIIEPGTPKGFSHIRLVRDKLIALGGYVVAPCPHAQTCPIQEPDWCHFSTRLNRTYHHKMAKNAELSFEDEKFSYLIVSKKSVPSCSARILRPPQKREGHVIFSLCTPDGLKTKTITKKEKEIYKQSKKFDWGDKLFS